MTPFTGAPRFLVSNLNSRYVSRPRREPPEIRHSRYLHMPVIYVKIDFTLYRQISLQR